MTYKGLLTNYVRGQRGGGGKMLTMAVKGAGRLRQMLTLADKGVRQMLTLADKGGGVSGY